VTGGQSAGPSLNSQPSTLGSLQPSALSPSNGDLVRVDGLVKYYPVRGGLLYRTVAEVKAVDDVSFAIKSGETFGLVGESGCGKKTAGRAVLRLIEPDSGEIWFEGVKLMRLNGEDMNRRRRARGDEIQFIFAYVNQPLSI